MVHPAPLSSAAVLGSPDTQASAAAAAALDSAVVSEFRSVGEAFQAVGREDMGVEDVGRVKS